MSAGERWEHDRCLCGDARLIVHRCTRCGGYEDAETTCACIDQHGQRTVERVAVVPAEQVQGAIGALCAIAEPCGDYERSDLSIIARDALRAMGVSLSSERRGQ